MRMYVVARLRASTRVCTSARALANRFSAALQEMRRARCTTLRVFSTNASDRVYYSAHTYVHQARYHVQAEGAR